MSSAKVFRHSVLSVVNPHMGTLLALQNQFLHAGLELCLLLLDLPTVFKESSSFFPKRNHPFFQLHVTKITHHREGIDKGAHIFFLILEIAQSFQISFKMISVAPHFVIVIFSEAIGSFFYFVHSFTSLFTKYLSSTSCTVGTVLDSGNTSGDKILMEIAF